MRTLIRAILVLVLLVGVVMFLFGSWAGSKWGGRPAGEPAPVATTGATDSRGIDTQKARERGAEIGEKTAVAAAKMRDAMGEASLTTKIKAKMALDDTIKARAIDVTTNGSTVTLSGIVRSQPERDRAIALAKETAGVTAIVDHLRIER